MRGQKQKQTTKRTVRDNNTRQIQAIFDYISAKKMPCRTYRKRKQAEHIYVDGLFSLVVSRTGSELLRSMIQVQPRRSTREGPEQRVDCLTLSCSVVSLPEAKRTPLVLDEAQLSFDAMVRACGCCCLVLRRFFFSSNKKTELIQHKNCHPMKN